MLKLRYLLIALGAVAMIAALSAQTAEAASVRVQPNGAVRFYDDQGGDRGYEWCLQGGGSDLGIPVCDYYTEAQCRASLVNVGFCVPNPWSYYVKVPRQRLQLQ
jgi:hypothetical protein